MNHTAKAPQSKGGTAAKRLRGSCADPVEPLLITPPQDRTKPAKCATVSASGGEDWLEVFCKVHWDRSFSMWNIIFQRLTEEARQEARVKVRTFGTWTVTVHPDAA